MKKGLKTITKSMNKKEKKRRALSNLVFNFKTICQPSTHTITLLIFFFIHPSISSSIHSSIYTLFLTFTHSYLLIHSFTFSHSSTYIYPLPPPTIVSTSRIPSRRKRCCAVGMWRAGGYENVRI